MSSLQRRYEILLPLRFNDGQAVPDDLIAETLLELEQRFGAISSESQIIHGMWASEGQTYRDEWCACLSMLPIAECIASSFNAGKSA